MHTKDQQLLSEIALGLNSHDTQGLQEISATECVQDYGYLDLQEHLKSMLK